MSNPAIDLGGEHAGTFGEGGEVPYERALRARGGGGLRLHAVGDADAAMSSLVDIDRYTTSADAVDLAILARSSGSVLDLGCGPGRMVEAAVAAGRRALGIDLSTSAIALARAAHLPVVQASVFDPLPREGSWRQALLLDGNVGIGGDVDALLRRCIALLHARGRLVVEANGHGMHRRAFDAVLVDDSGASSEPFPWAEVGPDALEATARDAGLDVTDRWTDGGRAFVELARRAARPRAR